MRWLYERSIWHPDAIDEREGEVARDLKRWVLPTVDFFLIVGSYLGLNGGLPTFALVYNHAVASVLSAAVLLFAVGCLIGVSFPRLWVLELSAKCGLALVLLTYAFFLLVLAAGEYPTRGFVAGVTAALCAVIVGRIIWLCREERRRRAAAELLRALRQKGD